MPNVKFLVDDIAYINAEFVVDFRSSIVLIFFGIDTYIKIDQFYLTREKITKII